MNDTNKWSNHRKDEIKQWKEGGLIALGLGLLLMIMGICGVVWTNSDYRAYKASDDIRTVEGVIGTVNHKYKQSGNQKKDEIWEANVTYEVDGKEYHSTAHFAHEVSSGNTIKLEVYRNSKGDYRIPITTSAPGVGFYSILFGIMTIFGVFLLGSSVYLLYGSKKIAEALEEKKRQKEAERRR